MCDEHAGVGWGSARRGGVGERPPSYGGRLVRVDGAMVGGGTGRWRSQYPAVAGGIGCALKVTWVDDWAGYALQWVEGQRVPGA